VGLTRRRFLSEDPVGVAALVQHNEPNLYRYVRNNPVRNIDPTGLLTTCVPIGGKSWTSTRVYPDNHGHWIFLAVFEDDTGALFPRFNGWCIWGRGSITETRQYTMVHELCFTDSVGCSGAPGVFTRWAPPTFKVTSHTTSQETRVTPATIPEKNGHVCDSPPE
jgi:hypothetical protein